MANATVGTLTKRGSLPNLARYSKNDMKRVSPILTGLSDISTPPPDIVQIPVDVLLTPVQVLRMQDRPELPVGEEPRLLHLGNPTVGHRRVDLIPRTVDAAVRPTGEILDKRTSVNQDSMPVADDIVNDSASASSLCSRAFLTLASPSEAEVC